MVNSEKLQPGEIYAVAVATLPPEDIDHHASDYFPGIASDFSAAVLDCLKKATESSAAFNKFINSRRKLLIRPYRKSAAEYIRLELETALTVPEIISAVRNNMEV
jgi:hypothetical protein